MQLLRILDAVFSKVKHDHKKFFSVYCRLLSSFMLVMYNVVINLLQHAELVDLLWEWHSFNKSGICALGDNKFCKKSHRWEQCTLGHQYNHWAAELATHCTQYPWNSAALWYCLAWVSHSYVSSAFTIQPWKCLIICYGNEFIFYMCVRMFINWLFVRQPPSVFCAFSQEFLVPRYLKRRI
jgi:hypothetical protein